MNKLYNLQNELNDTFSAYFEGKATLNVLNGEIEYFMTELEGIKYELYGKADLEDVLKDEKYKMKQYHFMVTDKETNCIFTLQIEATSRLEAQNEANLNYPEWEGYETAYLGHE